LRLPGTFCREHRFLKLTFVIVEKVKFLELTYYYSMQDSWSLLLLVEKTKFLKLYFLSREEGHIAEVYLLRQGSRSLAASTEGQDL
jgi:hypothetical protein